jgi:hypothetical protein
MSTEAFERTAWAPMVQALRRRFDAARRPYAVATLVVRP